MVEPNHSKNQRENERGKPMITIITAPCVTIEINGTPLLRCREVARGEKFDCGRIRKVNEHHYEYSGTYSIVRDGEFCTLVLE